MKPLKRVLIVVCCLMPAIAAAQVHKCRSPDGSLRYSDQPCPGAAPTVGEMRRTRVPEPPLPAVGPSVPPASPQPTAPRTPGKVFDRGPPPRQKDIEMLQEVERRYNRYLAERSDRCRAGDSEACISQACQSVLHNRGPVDDFKACAQAFKRPVGDNWIAHGGEPWKYGGPAQAEKDRKLSRTYPALTELVCLPRKPPGVEVVGTVHFIAEYATREGGSVFELRNGPGVRPVQYSSIEALAADACGK